MEEWRRKIEELSKPVVVAQDASDHQSLIDTSAGGSSSVHDHLELDAEDRFPKAMGHRGHVRGKGARRFHELDSQDDVYELDSQGDASAMSRNGTRAVLRRDQRNAATVVRRCAGWRPSCLARRPYAIIGCIVCIPFACSAVVVVVSKLLFGSEQALPELGARQVVERSRTTTGTMPPLPPQPPVLSMPPPTPSLPQPLSDPPPPAGRNSDFSPTSQLPRFPPPPPPPSPPSPPPPLSPPPPSPPPPLSPPPPSPPPPLSPPPLSPPPLSPPPLSPPPEEVCRAEHCTDVNNDCCAPLSLGERATCARGYTPKRVGRCGEYDQGQFVCCGPHGPSLDPSLERLQRAFATDGLLVHTFHWSNEWETRLHAATSLDELQLVEADCGKHCVALSLLHARLPVQLFCPECAPPAHAVDIK